MSGMRARLAWLVNGPAQVHAALDDHAAAIRALQEKLARLEAELESLRSGDATTRSGVDRLGDELAAMRQQLRDAVDDLGDRLGAVADRVG